MSCKLELELCGYVKDNCTKALEVCDFDCEECNSEIREVFNLLIGLFFFIAICIILPGYCWWSRQQAKKQKQKDRLDLATYRSQTRQPYTDSYGNPVIVTVPQDSRVPDPNSTLNQPTVF